MRDHNFIFINGIIICLILITPNFMENVSVNLHTPNELLNLEFFLETNNVNQKEYLNGYYDCREFSTDLIHDLRESGFNCGYAILRPVPELRKTIGDESESDKITLHRITWVEINKEILFIEPQTDAIYNFTELKSHYKNKKYVDVVIDGYHPYYFTVSLNSTTLDPSQYTEPENDSKNIVTRRT